MTELLTESFCERCGTRYTFESAAPRRSRIARVRVLSKGLRNFVMSDETTLSEAMADARSEEELAATALQLDAFHRTFNFCLSCRQYTCGACWNTAEGRCLTCSPIPGQELVDHPAAAPVHEPPAPAAPSPIDAIDAWPEPVPAAWEPPGVAAPAEADLNGASTRHVSTAGEVDATTIGVGTEEASAAEPADWASMPPDDAGDRAAEPPLPLGLEPGQTIEDAIAAYEAQLVAAEAPVAPTVEPQPVAAEAPVEPTVEPEPVAEPVVVAAEAPVKSTVEPEPVAEPVVVAAEAPVAPTVEPEPVAVDAPVAPQAEPEPVAVEAPVEPETEPVVASTDAPVALQAEPEPEAEPVVVAAEAPVEPTIEPEPVAAAAPVEPQAEPPTTPVRDDVVPQPTWTAPVATPVSTPAVAPVPAAADGAAPALPAAAQHAGPWLTVAPEVPLVEAPPSAPPAAPQWPAQPAWVTRPPAGRPGAPATLAGRPLLPADASGLWAASNMEVVQAPAATGPQPCVSCGLSLSANARFCRRCGARQG